MSGGSRELVAAIVPNARGFGYAVFEGLLPVDWGVSDVRGVNRNHACLRRIATVLRKYNPDVLLLRDPAETRSRRVAALIEAIAALPMHSGMVCLAVTRAQVREAFHYLERPSRERIARSIADRIPFLEPLLPPIRKIWNSEDRRMGLFDAVALVLAYVDDGIMRSSEAAE